MYTSTSLKTVRYFHRNTGLSLPRHGVDLSVFPRRLAFVNQVKMSHCQRRAQCSVASSVSSQRIIEFIQHDNDIYTVLGSSLQEQEFPGTHGMVSSPFMSYASSAVSFSLSDLI